MLTPFTALLPTSSDIEYWALERAAKVLRQDPARYQSVEGIEYLLTRESLFHWTIEFEAGVVEGLVGLFPLASLLPHEATTPAAIIRPQHPVQIRPVMGLIEVPLPSTEPVGPTVHFHGEHHHAVTPVAAVTVDVDSAVIADGHHRVAAAIRTAEHPLIMTLLVSAPGSPLDAGTFHRVFSRTVTIPDEIAGCEVRREPPRESIHAGRMAIVTRDGSAGVEVTDSGADQVVRGLPAGLAADYVLPALGLAESEASYEDDIRVALAAVDDAGTAVILPRSRIDSVIASARRGVRVPPKSTRFRPKPIRGLLMRPLPR